MDARLPLLLSFPPAPPPETPPSDAECDKQYRAILKELHETSESTLTGGIEGGKDALDVSDGKSSFSQKADVFQLLDPSVNSLPYLFVLLAHIKHAYGKSNKDKPVNAFKPGQPLWRRMETFVDHFDPLQIRYVGHETRRLLELIVNGAERASEAGAPKASCLPLTDSV